MQDYIMLFTGLWDIYIYIYNSKLLTYSTNKMFKSKALCRLILQLQGKKCTTYRGGLCNRSAYCPTARLSYAACLSFFPSGGGLWHDAANCAPPPSNVKVEFCQLVVVFVPVCQRFCPSGWVRPSDSGQPVGHSLLKAADAVTLPFKVTAGCH